MQCLVGFYLSVMNFESLLPLLFFLGIFLFAFFIEALVIYFSRLKTFWKSVGMAMLLNAISMAVIYFVAAPLLSTLGYQIGQFNGLNLPVHVAIFLCWLSIMIEGAILRFFSRTATIERIFGASILMNILSFLFLHFFIAYSH
ncbi:MAG TPA: hypothetical protein VER36_11100 [Flavisolibacter sp.]|nr:hypothetical protein [Flavisolibacter sp.]